MLSLSVKVRENEKPSILRKEGVLPAVLYGPEIKETLSLKVDLKEFKKVYQEAGESSMINLKVEDKTGKEREFSVFVHGVQQNPLTNNLIHIDFYQPRLKEEMEADVALEFVGEAPAVKELAGTLVKNIQAVEVKALPQNLPHEIKVDISGLKTFEDHILVKDLKVSSEVKILKEADEVVALVVPPERIEEELEKPIEEKVEEVEKAGEKERVEEAEEKKNGREQE